MTEIRTERLVLRHARPDDAEPLHVIFSDPLAMRWWSSLPHETLDQTRAWVEAMMAGNAAGAPDFIIEWNGRAIGKAGFWRLPDVGYILHPDAWGQGLAQEAVRAAIDHVFAEGLTDIVTADVDPENTASIRLLERLGFARTGSAERTWNIGGELKDSLYYALDRVAWTGRLNSGS
ncbi:acetyltransferase [Brevundimonas sp. AAP58]|uniref:GNAT family N-acetyltransferase n=1 Tax=Brevundimonas sp. AAP58 TaxID=1523422 RepID=UPI0006B9CA7B|nr:GNAT family N-acetyltransferase [Brevundimonas sp. AAP58]KPF77567.1 acetyltransferase [Brevundimonas sp. AAP58]